MIRPSLYKSCSFFLVLYPMNSQSLHLADHVARIKALPHTTSIAPVTVAPASMPLSCHDIHYSSQQPKETSPDSSKPVHMPLPRHPASSQSNQRNLSKLQQVHPFAQIMLRPSLPFDHSSLGIFDSASSSFPLVKIESLYLRV